MSLNSYLVTDEKRPLPGSGWTSKNAANIDDSKAKYKEKLNIPRGQKGYIDPAVFNLNDDFNKDDLMKIEPKRSCVVEKPECVQYNYVIPEKYLKNGAKNAKIENRILENDYEELQAQHAELQTAHSNLGTAHDALQQQNNELLRQHRESNQQRDALQQQQLGNLQTRLDKATRELEKSRTENLEYVNQMNEINKMLNENAEDSDKIQKALLYSGPPPGFEGPPTGNKNLGGGTRHKKPRKRTKTQNRRTTRQLRSRKFPRKCFSLRKREK